MNKKNPTYFADYLSDQTPVGKIKSSDLITRMALYITLLFIFLLPWGDGLWDGLPRVAATLAISLSAVSFFIRGTHRNYTFFHFFIVLYIAWQIISLMWTSDVNWGTEVAITSFQLILLSFLFTLVIDNKSKVIAAYQAYVVGNIAGSAIIIYNYLNGIESPYYGRFGIKNIETDELSIFLALSIPMAAYLTTKYNNKILKIMNLAAIPIVFYSIFLTGTRTGSIVGLIGILYWLFTHRKSSFAIKASIAFVMIASIMVIFSFAPKASVDRIFSAGKSLTTGTLNHRSVIWAGSINQWEESPIIGPGLGSLGVSLSREYVNYRYAHNTFIHILAENGLIGIFFYLAILLTILYYIFHTPMDERAFLFALFMVLIVSQQTTHTQVQKIIWFVLSMLAIHSHLYHKKS